jgi:hypothetical protein
MRVSASEQQSRRPHFSLMLESGKPPPTRIQPQHPARLRAEVMLNGGLHRDCEAREPTGKVRTRQMAKPLQLLDLFDVN